MTHDTTRRALLKGAPAATALIALPAAISAQDGAPVAYTREEFEAGCKSAAQVAYFHMARAWIDRWEALGGYFSLRYDRDQKPNGIMRGMLCGTDNWTQTDEGREDIPPHARIVRNEDHSGAIRALEGLLELCPGMRDAVREIAGAQCMTRWAKGGEA
jgi:hypothetical protein